MRDAWSGGYAVAEEPSSETDKDSRMSFRITDTVTGQLNGNYTAFGPARDEAERLCAASGRTLHFNVTETREVFTTQTLDEALKPRTLADRPRVPANLNA